ncbi:DUF7507 domain-containing protein, partial [Dapis sp. BLCC M126]|uniref:DUF7507 domain-containing protein n=1 Tax=Dapis sp. BLCC M126 TaxID=3400189 RepID=UPI003CE963EA
YDAPTGSIGDTIFRDDNADGDQDDGEAGISGVEVRLTDKGDDGVFGTDDDVVIGTETTDADGKYLFDGLDAGNYQVEVLNNNGALDGLDQTADPDGTLDNGSMVELAQGEDNLDQDFGYDAPENPGIEIEKSTNDVDADTPDLAPEIAAGDTVTWTYEVTNTGDVSFDESEVVVTDDQEGIITNIIEKINGNQDNILDPGETWVYQQEGIAQDLSTVTNNVIDFETDAEGNPLPLGTVIDTEYSALGVTISATGGSNEAMIFDSANPTGGDGDLATNSEGNILIISEDGDSSDPDDNAGGGVITFDLDNPVDVNSINFVDIEEAGGQVFTTDADGNVTTTAIPAPGDGSLQTLNINDNDVVKIEVDLVGSGAISGLDFDSIADGIYKNIGTVVADDVEDSDPSHYVNPEPQNPDIEIEKFTNGVDADTVAEAVEIAAGETVTWTYEVTNTGDESFDESEVVVTDDQEGLITNIAEKINGNQDNVLEPGETWIYQEIGIAQDLSTTTTSEDITFHLTGNSYTTGPAGNTRNFTQDGVSVDVSAFSFNSHQGWRKAFLGAFGGGLGVTNQNEGGSGHRVDNGGSVDYIVFEFDKSVTPDRALLDYIEHDSDISIWVGDRTEDISLLDDSILNSFTKENNNGGNGGHDYKRWANFNADELTGDTFIIAANPDQYNDAFKFKKLDISVPGETTIDNYVNIGTVTAGSVSDQDPSSYTNPEGEPEPQNPGIDIEKSTNGVDADTIEEAVEIAAGETVTWTYEVTNTGDVPFDESEVEVTDDQEGTITNITNQGDEDNILAPGETWIYEQTGIAQNLTTTTSAQDIHFTLTGNSYTTGPAGNTRHFTQDGVSVDVSAFSFNSHQGWRTAFLGAYGGGLGVTNQNESGSGHRVDNGGSIDYILFEFDQDVTVDKAFLKYVEHDSDISIWIGDSNEEISAADFENGILDGFTKENNYGGSYDRWADFNADELTGNTVVIAARDDDDYHNDSFKLKNLDISIPGETTIGNYVNIGTVTAGSVTDEDQSGYTNPEAEPQNPGIDIEKFTNGENADTVEDAAVIEPHHPVTWTYEVTNTGNVPFDKADIQVTDDQEGTITHISNQADGDDILAPGETWVYQETGTAQDLTTVIGGESYTFNLTGNSPLDGQNGNIRTFDAGDVSVNASAFSSDPHGVFQEAYLGAFSSGLGVTDNSEGDGTHGLHRIDNVYQDNFVLLEFSKEIVVDRAFLDSVGADSDITYWVGNKEDAFNNHNFLDQSFLDSLEFTEDNYTHSAHERWADINNGEVSGNILVVAAAISDDTPEDRFKLKTLEVHDIETTEAGFYQNLGTVEVNGLIDEDLSNYVNPDYYI